MKGLRSILVVSVACLMISACGGGPAGVQIVNPGGSNSGGSSQTPPPSSQLQITSTLLKGAVAGAPFSATLTASGGTAPYKWDAPQGLYAGWSFSQAGVLSGTPPKPTGGNCCELFTVRVTDSATPAATVTTSVTLDIFGLSPYPPLVPYPQVNVSTYFIFVAAGGTPPSQWIASGTPPPGMSFQTDGADPVRQYDLRGTPSQAGTFPFSLTITDSSSPLLSETVQYSERVEGPPLALKHSPLPPAVVGQSYLADFPFTGGTPRYSWSLSPVQLPAGLQLDSTQGALVGTPTVPGCASFAVTLRDSSAPTVQHDQQNYWILVTPNPLPPRNDTIATATPIFSGTCEASISPHGDPPGTWAPDEDYYSMTAAAGTTFSVSIGTYDVHHYNVQSPLDPVVEVVDGTGARFKTCNDPNDDNPPANLPIAQDPTPNGYDDPCMNHGGDPNSIGPPSARLGFKVPGTSGNVNIYIHVFDFSGKARPDMFYILTVQ